MIGNVNAVVKMKRLGKVLQKDVRARKPGLFRNTLIPDWDRAYGYDRDGNVYLIDVEDVPLMARYMWHLDESGYCVTDQVRYSDGRPARMEELVMGRFEG